MKRQFVKQWIAEESSRMINKKAIQEAIKEGRICNKCGWIITKINWAKGYRQCAGCYDVMKGVNVKTGAMPYLDESLEKTGEM